MLKRNVCKGTVVERDIIKHMNKTDNTQRSHGYSYCKPAHALKFIEIENAGKFIRNYADEFGIP